MLRLTFLAADDAIYSVSALFCFREKSWNFFRFTSHFLWICRIHFRNLAGIISLAFGVLVGGIWFFLWESGQSWSIWYFFVYSAIFQAPNSVEFFDQFFDGIARTFWWAPFSPSWWNMGEPLVLEDSIVDLFHILSLGHRLLNCRITFFSFSQISRHLFLAGRFWVYFLHFWMLFEIFWSTDLLGSCRCLKNLATFIILFDRGEIFGVEWDHVHLHHVFYLEMVDGLASDFEIIPLPHV